MVNSEELYWGPLSRTTFLGMPNLEKIYFICFMTDLLVVEVKIRHFKVAAVTVNYN